MTTLTRDDIVAALRPVDDTVVAQILAMKTTPEELAEAQAWMTSDDALIDAGRPLPSGRVASLVEILETIAQEEDAALDPR